MNKTILATGRLTQDEVPIEIVEKKGVGHPDTLADSIAEAISYVYSNYCLKNYGYVLHHNVDKISVLGGKSTAGFRLGEQLDPIRIIINGRMSDQFGKQRIPIFDIASDTAKKYLLKVIPTLDPAKDIKIFDFLNRAGGAPHKGNRWFKPASVKDLPEVSLARANDTASVVGFCPLSKVEELTLLLHKSLMEEQYTPKYGFIGTDVKSMVVRVGKNVSITMCVPFLGKQTPNLDFYIEHKKMLRDELFELAQKYLGEDYRVSVDINTRDKPEIGDLYILAHGTAAESGDEGVVGRGNRSIGFIASNRPYSIEAPQGKNPTYFGGKIYDYFATSLSKEIFGVTGIHSAVYVITQNGTPIKTPTNILVELSGQSDCITSQTRHQISGLVDKHLDELQHITSNILQKESTTFSFLTK